MQKHGWAAKPFLVDGFPRNEDNKQGWDNILGGITEVKFTLFLECGREILIERINKRAAEAEAAGQEKRNDDNLEVLNKRFDTFIQQSIPIVEGYEK